MCHRKFFSKLGDLVTSINVFNTWSLLDSTSSQTWCIQNYINHRSLIHASAVRLQLETIVRTQLGFNTFSSCGTNEEVLLHCLARGLFLNVATLVSSQNEDQKASLKEVPDSKIKSKFSDRYSNVSRNKTVATYSPNILEGDLSAPYRTLSGQAVYIHPSSVVFSFKRHNLPKYVIYSELLRTNKTYMRGITAIDIDSILNP